MFIFWAVYFVTLMTHFPFNKSLICWTLNVNVLKLFQATFLMTLFRQLTSLFTTCYFVYWQRTHCDFFSVLTLIWQPFLIAIISLIKVKCFLEKFHQIFSTILAWPWLSHQPWWRLASVTKIGTYMLKNIFMLQSWPHRNPLVAWDIFPTFLNNIWWGINFIISNFISCWLKFHVAIYCTFL